MVKQLLCGDITLSDAVNPSPPPHHFEGHPGKQVQRLLRPFGWPFIRELVVGMPVYDESLVGVLFFGTAFRELRGTIQP